MNHDILPEESPIFVKGHNCWRVCKANHVELIIDAEQYFSDLKTALLSAEKQILIIGWDFDTRVSLDGPDGPESLGEFITQLVRSNRSLRIYILKWNFAFIKLLGRGAMILRLLKWMAHPRIKVKFDSAHPVGASHHQKLIIIDGNLAFCGGIDVTSGRWDNRQHEDGVTNRHDPDGNFYAPWHDISLAIDGNAANSLAELARIRWEIAGGRAIEAVNVKKEWPFPDRTIASHIDVAIMRTRGEYKDNPEIRENETMFLDLILNARHHIYLENQYFASRVIAAAIARRLSEPDPPEIILVMPENADGWLEQVAMDTARAHHVGLLRKIDTQKRFRIFHPFASKGTAIYVHAKLMIVDDVVLRVGSSNMNNRSMGFDSECDCLIDARSSDDKKLSGKIKQIRISLLAEHLGKSEEIVKNSLESTSMIETIERLSGSGRSLRPYVLDETNELADYIANENLLDPIDEKHCAAEKISQSKRWWNRIRKVRA